MLAMFEGFVLQGLVTPLLSKVVHPNKNNIYMSQMYIIAQRGRIVATILPLFPFWDSFFSLSLQNTQWNDRKTGGMAMNRFGTKKLPLPDVVRTKLGIMLDV